MSFKTYEATLSQVEQMIPINNDIVNFKATVTITSETRPFEAAVVEKQSLQNGQGIPFQEEEKGMSVSVSSNDNIHREFILVMKSDLPVQVKIQIHIEQLHPPLEEKERFNIVGTISPYQDYIAVGVVCIVIGVLLYKYKGPLLKKAEVPKTSSSLLDKLKNVPLVD